jgi:PAS domain S-box-containing protein
VAIGLSSSHKEISLVAAPATLGSISARRGDQLAPAPRPVRAPDLAELETLVVCAAEGSLVAAAARLGISRPGVAKRIDNLEALAARPLLDRGARGVRLTDAGATLLAGARRVLDERDALLGTIAEIRGEGSSPIAGLRDLLGHTPVFSRAAQRPEARLAETERMLGLLLSTSATAIVISEPDTAVIHELNDAFCRFAGRSREELLSRPATADWYDPSGRDRLIEEIRRSGAAERVVVGIRRPDGTPRFGEVSSHFVVLAGRQLLLSTVEDVTERHRLAAEREAVSAAQGALGQLAADLFAGGSATDSIGDILPELRRSGRFTTALVWDAERAHALIVDGPPPPPGLDRVLRRGRTVSPDGVLRLESENPPGGALGGWAAWLPGEHAVVLLCGDSPADPAQDAFAPVLSSLATIVSASGARARLARGGRPSV